MFDLPFQEFLDTVEADGVSPKTDLFVTDALYDI